jgi:hypothetical protein
MTKPSEHAVEGRANLARPSLCLLAFAVVVCLAVNAATAHAEQPKELTLSGTNPRSSEMEPAGSTTPRVRGSDEGVGKSGINFGLTKKPISSVSSPTNVVKVFTDPECKTTPIGTGTYSELEGNGIQVEVAPDSVTTFYANQAEAGEQENPSACSKKGLAYYESSTGAPPPSEPPPNGGTSPSGEGSQGSGNSTGAPAPPRLHTVPGGRANNNMPSIVGAAPGASQVKIFSNSGCAGAPFATVSPAELSGGISARVSDNSVTDFAAISIAKGKQSFCSTAATYIEDSSPPRVRITMGPGAKTRRHKTVFRFADISGEPTGTSFSCRVNHGKWKSCTSPFKLRHLHFRRYVLRVRATDDVGNTEAKPVKRSFKVIH